MQTSPSGPSLGALSLDNTPKGGVERNGAGADEFSQEYDKQVKNIESRQKSEEPAESSKAEQGEHAEATDKSEAKDQASAEGSEQAANDEEQSGNTLPLEQMRKMAAEAQLKAAGESQDEDDTVADESLEPATAEGEVADQTLAGLVTQTQQDSTKISANQAVAAAVKQASADKADSTKTLVTDELAGEELAPDEAEQGDLQLKSRGKSDDFAALMARQSKSGQGAEGVPRGDRNFDALLASQGRTQTAAASIDTLTPGIVPLSGQGASNPLATPVPLAMTLATPMHHANWGQAMGERVVWMTNANIQEAEIQLNPRELGPIGIKVTMQNDQTHVSFVAQNATTREALEQALPRLREMLSENGLQLGQSDVSQHGSKERDGEPGDGDGRGSGAAGDETLRGEEHLLAAETLRGVGYTTPSGVDAFA